MKDFVKRDTLHTKHEYRGPKRDVRQSKGHDAVLKALQDGGRKTTITLLSGDQYEGKVVGRDKFTITLLIKEGSPSARRLVIYKHAIECFFGEEGNFNTQGH